MSPNFAKWPWWCFYLVLYTRLIPNNPQDMSQGGRLVQSYKAVIIATPLEHADLTFQEVSLPHIPRRAYQDTVTTVIRGSLQASFFNVTTLPQGEPFQDVIVKGHLQRACRLFKSLTDLQVQQWAVECAQSAIKADVQRMVCKP